jgi:hypothetical protein
MTVEYRTMTRPHEHSELYTTYMISPAWRVVRRRKLREVGWCCEVCRARRRLQVHHRSYAHLGHESLRELRVVCVRHHDQIGRLHNGGLPLDRATDLIVPRRGALRRLLWRLLP